MASSSRHLYPEWLHTERLRSRRARAGADPGRAHDRRDDGPWRLWAWLRAFDRRNTTLVDLGLALALFVLCSGWVVNHDALRPSLWFVAALTFPLIFRRRAPMTVFLVIAAVAFVQWLVTGPGAADVALLVALYTVAVESEWPLVTAAVVILEAGVVMATLRWEPVRNNVQSIVFLTGLVFTALLAGVVVRALRSQLDWLVERAERLEVERDQQASLAAAAERARIAREMHDVVSHNIQVMVTLADAAALAQASDPERAAEAVHEVSSTGRQALTDMRRMLGVLREEPEEPTTGGSAGVPCSGSGSGSGGPPYAPQPGLGELPALVERIRGTGLDVSVRCDGVPFELSDAAGLTVYRVVQEALTNSLKHAEGAHAVEVELSFADPDVAVRVTDDGRSTVAVPTGAAGAAGGGSGVGSGGGHGLAGMAERATAFGGTLTAGPRPTGGWAVEAVLRDCKAPAPA
jgi:signal transduction histidine kinase